MPLLRRGPGRAVHGNVGWRKATFPTAQRGGGGRPTGRLGGGRDWTLRTFRHLKDEGVLEKFMWPQPFFFRLEANERSPLTLRDTFTK